MPNSVTVYVAANFVSIIPSFFLSFIGYRLQVTFSQLNSSFECDVVNCVCKHCRLNRNMDYAINHLNHFHQEQIIINSNNVCDARRSVIIAVSKISRYSWFIVFYRAITKIKQMNHICKDGSTIEYFASFNLWIL